jgi:hypothetical protein
MICSPCFEVDLPSCPALIVLNAGLVANTSYRWEIVGFHGKIFNGTVQTDATGLLGMDTSSLPAGQLNPHAGSYQLRVLKILSPTSVQKASFMIDTKSYDCILMRFHSYEPQISYLDVDAPVFALPSITAPVQVVFTNQTVVTVTHNLGYRPLVQVLDNSDTIMSADVDHISINEFVVTMLTPQSGKILYR